MRHIGPNRPLSQVVKALENIRLNTEQRECKDRMRAAKKRAQQKASRKRNR